MKGCQGVMNRFSRKLVSLLGIAAVMFAQLAVSAHACPMQLMGMGEPAAVVASTEATADEADAGSPALCQKHCENSPQNATDSPQPLVLFSPEPAFAISLAMEIAALLPVATLTPSLLRATSPPLSIRNCCFRI
jgi:hypothetical protein